VFPVDKIFPLVLRFEAFRRWVCAARSPTRRIGAGLALTNGEDFCEAFLCGSVWVGPANIYLAPDRDGLENERSASCGKSGKGTSRDATNLDRVRATWRNWGWLRAFCLLVWTHCKARREFCGSEAVSSRRSWPRNREDDCLLRRWLFESTWTNQIVATYSLLYPLAVQCHKDPAYWAFVRISNIEEMAPNPQCAALAAAKTKTGTLSIQGFPPRDG